MAIKINYKKIKNIDEINLDLLEINNYQCYSPILEKLFVLNESNFNKIIFKSNFVLKKILHKKSYNLFTCILENDLISDIKMDVFFKFAPLFDPVKYTTGRIKDISYKHSILPKYNDNTVYSYIKDYNNVSYVDNFFTYISSLLLNDYTAYCCDHKTFNKCENKIHKYRYRLSDAIKWLNIIENEERIGGGRGIARPRKNKKTRRASYIRKRRISEKRGKRKRIYSRKKRYRSVKL